MLTACTEAVPPRQMVAIQIETNTREQTRVIEKQLFLRADNIGSPFWVEACVLRFAGGHTPTEAENENISDLRLQISD